MEPHPYVFISHSSSDEVIAKKVAKRLGRDRAWVDFWNLEAGDILPQKIAEAIASSKWFVLLASEKSMQSKWVRYELNMALIRWIQESDCRIIAARVDHCTIHPELSPFLRVDLPGQPDKIAEKIAALIIDENVRAPQGPKEKRKRIVDRFDEIAAIERLLHEKIKFVYLWGIYGIGKTSVIERAAVEVFHTPMARFALTESHGLLRLSLELCARAGLSLPSAGHGEKELLRTSCVAVNKIRSSGNLLVFDDVENVLEIDGRFRPFFEQFLGALESELSDEVPVFLLSTRQPPILGLPAKLQRVSHVTKVGPLQETDLLNCLENWIALASPGAKLPSRDKLKLACGQLFGYPLAARLAAYYVVRHSVDTLLEEVKYFKNIRIDIAKQLLGRARVELGETESRCMEALAVAGNGASLSEITAAISVSTDQARTAIENLSSALLVFVEDGRLQIHPIVKDYFGNNILG